MKVVIANAPCVIPLEDGREKYFVRAGSRWPFSIIKERATPLTGYVPFPFYIAYSTALLERDGFDVTAIDAIPLNWDTDTFVRQVCRLQPDLLVMESTTPTFRSDVALIQQIKKETGCLVALSGSHVTAFPQVTLNNYPDVDYVLLGEYEANLLALCRSLSKSRTSPDLEGLKGIGARNDLGVYLQAEKAVISDLNSLPYPAWHQFPTRETHDLNYYWDNIIQLKPAAQMHSSRGCPFRCNFCVWISVMYDNSKLRAFSPSRVCDEMEELHTRYGIREVYFDDDIFTGNKRQVMALTAEMKRRNIRDEMRWSVMGDAMVCDEEMIEAMAEAGCIAMKFGVESGDPAVLKKINKPLNLEKAKKVAKWATMQGIKTHATFSIGLLGETYESMQRTLQYAKELEIDTLQVSITTPFPGTPFYRQAKGMGLLTSETWEDFDGLNTSVVRYEILAHDQIESFADMFATRWLRHKVRDPKWIGRQVRNFYRILRFQGMGGMVQVSRAGMRVLLKQPAAKPRMKLEEYAEVPSGGGDGFPVGSSHE